MREGGAKGKGDCTLITPAVLRRLSLPQPRDADDKEARGRVLVIGGSREMPGAAVLAATAALRAGAGKLRISTVEGVAPHVAVNVPEARVYALPETRGGDVAATASEKILELMETVDAVLIGPGMIDEGAAGRLLKKVLAQLRDAPLVLDANALACLSNDPTVLHRMKGRVVVTPQAEEMAGILGVEMNAVVRQPVECARRAATELRAVVALKGRETFVVPPGGGACYCNSAGNVGLATSGSGDVLAGLIAGLLARGADPIAATVWGVHVHARAGDSLSRKVGRLGFLARELLAEIPSVLDRLTRGGK